MSDSTQKSGKTVQALRAAGNLPSPQGVALAIMEVTRDENATVDELARLIATDPALSGKLIHAANGIRHGARRAVAAVPDAVTVLGLSGVRQLALGFSLISSYRGGACRSFDYKAFWSQSLLTAIATPVFAAQARVAAADELFICGLLARVGRLGLATAHPVQYGAVLDAHRSAPASVLADREAAALGISAVELTAEMLEGWGISHHLVEPLQHHEEARCSHFPEGSRGAMLRSMLRLSTCFADLCHTDEAARRRLMPQLFLLATQAGLSADDVIALGDQVVMEWRDWAQLLEMPSHQLKSYAALAAEMPEQAAGGSASPGAMRVLVVAGDRRIAAMLQDALGGTYEVHVAHDSRGGIACALDIDPHIIITDWNMQGLTGIGLCRALREAAVSRGIYMVIMTENTDDECLVSAFEAGADDVVAKPFRMDVMLARLRAAQRMWGLRDEIDRDRGEIRRFSSELVIANRRLQEIALSDAITHLPNRRHAMDRLQQEWSASVRVGNPISCVVVEIDRLDQINETLGHDGGDAVLREIAARMRIACRKQDVLCRIGGNRFMLICPDSMGDFTREHAARVERQIAGDVFLYRGVQMKLSACTGIAVSGGAVGKPDDLIAAAERALHAARDSGSRRIRTVAAGGGSAAA